MDDKRDSNDEEASIIDAGIPQILAPSQITHRKAQTKSPLTSVS